MCVSTISLVDLTKTCLFSAAIAQSCLIFVLFWVFCFFFFCIHLPFQPAGGTRRNFGCIFSMLGVSLRLPSLRFQVCAVLLKFIPLSCDVAVNVPGGETKALKSGTSVCWSLV